MGIAAGPRYGWVLSIPIGMEAADSGHSAPPGGQQGSQILSFLQSLQIPDLEPAEVNFCPPYAPPRCLPHPSRPSRTAGDRRSLRIWVGRGGSGVCLRGDSAVLSAIAIGVGFLVAGGLTPDCLLPIDVSIQVGVAFGGARSHTTEPEPEPGQGQGHESRGRGTGRGS